MKKLVLFEFHLLGDAVMSLPFLRAAQADYDVFVCCSPAAARAYELLLPAERIFPTELPSWKRGRSAPGTGPESSRTWAAVRALNAAVGVTVWADIRVHLLMRWLGLPERVGFEMNRQNYYAHHLGWRRRNLAIGQTVQTLSKLAQIKPLTISLERRDYRQHHVLDWSQLGERLGLKINLDEPWLGPPTMKRILPERARPFFERNAGRKIWLLHPGAAREWRRWPHFQDLVKTVFSPADIPLVVLEDPAAARIEASHPNCLIWPMSTLAEFVALAAHCDHMICNDSAAAHIGAALRKHVVAIFSSGSPDWFAPWTERTVIESFSCPYRPCLDRCLQPRYVCLDDLPLEKVVEQVRALL